MDRDRWRERGRDLKVSTNKATILSVNTDTDEEILDRCTHAPINEGARILEQGYALRSVDIDIVYLTGYGFPAYRGGPMFYADTAGLANIYARVLELQRMQGSRWESAPLLRRLAEEGRTFSSFGTMELQKTDNKAHAVVLAARWCGNPSCWPMAGSPSLYGKWQ